MMGLLNKFTGLAGAATSGIVNAATSLAGTVVLGAVTLTDARNLFKLIDMAPGIPDREADPAMAEHALVLLQQGRLTFAINFNAEDGISAEFFRTAPLSEETLKTIAPTLDYSTSVLSAANAENEDSLCLLINKAAFAEHGNGITGDVIAKALLTPIENIPVAGGIAADALRRPVRGIATWILDTITATATGAANIVRHGLSGGPADPAP
jgi:hypothetical protein